MAGLLRQMAPDSNRVDSKVAAKQAGLKLVLILHKGSLKDSLAVRFKERVQ
jgi:hypothetical protein